MMRLNKTASGETRSVAGNAVLLHFRFQFAILLWVCVALSGWLLLAHYAGTDLLSEGAHDAPNAIAMCVHVQRNKALVQDIKRPKLVYLVTLYIITTLGVLSFALCQRHSHDEMDAASATMQDYVLCLKGFPQRAANDPHLEQEIEEFLREACSCGPIFVSVCWDFADHVDRVYQMVESETGGHDNRRRSVQTGSFQSATSARCPCLSEPLRAIARSLANAEQSVNHEHDVLALLETIKSTDTVFAIFPSESDRDVASKMFSSSDMVCFKREGGSYPIVVDWSMHRNESAPVDIIWKGFSFTSKTRALRTVAWSFKILLGIMFWAVLFYAPYAYYLSTTLGELGRPPKFIDETMFTVLVVCGNQLMYFLCNTAARSIGFRYADREQAAYIAFYCVAMLVNMMFDLTMIFFTSLLAFDAMGVRVDDGSFLSQVGTGIEVLHSSYLMQAALGQKLFVYNVMGCFVLPFLAEPIATAILPYHLSVRFVGSHRVGQLAADQMLTPPIIDLSRYADILLNMILVIIAFFFVSGYVLQSLLGILVGHLIIYTWDHYRILRVAQECQFSSYEPEQFAQTIAGIPCAFLASCVTFHAMDKPVGSVLTIVFLLHCCLHYIVLVKVIPSLRRPKKPTAKQYREIAAVVPANYLNTNPIHCLRSRYVRHHTPCVVPFVGGKEHLQLRNPSIGLYYSGRDPSALDDNRGRDVSEQCGESVELRAHT